MENVTLQNILNNQLLTKEQSMMVVRDLLIQWDLEELVQIFEDNEIQISHLQYMSDPFIAVLLKDFKVSTMINLKFQLQIYVSIDKCVC